jgi:hypothetical protein
VAEERLSVGAVVERNGGEEGRGKPDEVTGVGIGVAEAEYGGEGAGPEDDGECAGEE